MPSAFLRTPHSRLYLLSECSAEELEPRELRSRESMLSAARGRPTTPRRPAAAARYGRKAPPKAFWILHLRHWRWPNMSPRWLHSEYLSLECLLPQLLGDKFGRNLLRRLLAQRPHVVNELLRDEAEFHF